MANTILLRRRIKTAQNVSKTTKAMEMIAASKLKKAQHQAVVSRPYVNKLSDLTMSLASQRVTETYAYITPAKQKAQTLYVLIGPDKGLCGGLVTNLMREFMKLRHDPEARFITIGKKLEGPVATLAKEKLLATFHFGTTLPAYSQIFPIIELINSAYLSGQVSKVVLIAPHFHSLFSQVPTAVQLLPVPVQEQDASVTADMTFEPSADELLPHVLKQYIEMVLYQQFLESFASEQASRMMAMQNATKNAKEIVSSLKLLYNKARQERITKEILDISSAAIALAAEN